MIIRDATGERVPVHRDTINNAGLSWGASGAADDLAIDHIRPVARGGTNDLDNLQLLCRSCNSRKGART